MDQVTTCFSTIFDDGLKKMTGNEVYPIIGGAVSHRTVLEVINKCKDLLRYGSCLEKAFLIKKYTGAAVHLGSTLIWSRSMKSSFGYYYNPPFEFHAWNVIDGRIIDIALPGVIEKALRTEDHIGPIVTGRRPFILNGATPPSWVSYKTHEVINTQTKGGESKCTITAEQNRQQKANC